MGASKPFQNNCIFTHLFQALRLPFLPHRFCVYKNQLNVGTYTIVPWILYILWDTVHPIYPLLGTLWGMFGLCLLQLQSHSMRPCRMVWPWRRCLRNPNRKASLDHLSDLGINIPWESSRPNKKCWSLGWSMWRIPYCQRARFGRLGLPGHTFNFKTHFLKKQQTSQHAFKSPHIDHWRIVKSYTEWIQLFTR